MPTQAHNPDAPPAIDWEIPALRTGWRGAVDRFFGPGQTRAEIAVQIVGLPLLGALVAWPTVRAVQQISLPWWGSLILAVFAFDAIGGVLTNSTGSAKRWYHRPGTRAQRLGFVAVHVAHVLLLSICVLGVDWPWFWFNSSVLLSATVLVEVTPLSLKRPVATGLTVAAIVANSAFVALPRGLEWITLLLYVKLLLAHMTPEAPFRRARRPAARPAGSIR